MQQSAQQGVVFLGSNESKQSRNRSLPPTKCVFFGTRSPTFSELATKKKLREKITCKKGLFRGFSTCLKWRNRPAPTGSSPISYLTMLHIKPTCVSLRMDFSSISLPTMLHISTDLVPVDEVFMKLLLGCGSSAQSGYIPYLLTYARS